MTRKQELVELANANEVEVAERDTADDIAAKLEAAGVDVPENLAADDEPAPGVAETLAGTASTVPQPDVDDLKNDDVVPAVTGDADSDDPPVRTTKADTPVLTSLAVGAGQHVPPGDEYDEEGRPRETPSTAFAEPDEEAQERATREREADATDRYERPDND